MRANEFIIEKISYSKYNNDIKDEIYDALLESIKQFSKYLNSYNNEFFSFSLIKEQLNYNFLDYLEKIIKSKLEKIGLQILGTEQLSIRFIKIKNNGEAGYNYIVLNKQFIDDFRNILTTIVIDGMMDNGVIVDKDNIEMVDRADALRYLKIVDKSDIKYNSKIDDIIDELVGTYTHELVHIKQHSMQDSGKPTEYRSMLTKDKSKLQAVLAKMADGQSDSNDDKIYYSAIQEIPAHAHNAVLDIVSQYGNNVKSMEPEELNYYINDLTSLMNDKALLQSVYSSRISYYNKTFNHPGTPEYKVFKRFMKIVMTELQGYINNLKEYAQGKF